MSEKTPIGLGNLFSDKRVPEGLESFYTRLTDVVIQLNKTGLYQARLRREFSGSEESGPYLDILTPQKLYGEDEDGIFRGSLFVGFSDYSGHNPEKKVEVRLVGQEVITVHGDTVIQYFEHELSMNLTQEQLLAYLHNVATGQRNLRPDVGDTYSTGWRESTYEWNDLNTNPIIYSKVEYEEQLSQRK